MVTNGDGLQFSTKQLKAIEVLATSPDLTQEAVASEVGVCRDTLYDWRQKPEFVEAVNARARQYFSATIPKLYNRLGNLTGDAETDATKLNAIKLALQVSRELEVEGGVTINQPMTLGDVSGPAERPKVSVNGNGDRDA